MRERGDAALREYTEQLDHVRLDSFAVAVAEDEFAAAETSLTGEQLAALRAQGCDELQGYGLARPMPAEAFEALCVATEV